MQEVAHSEIVMAERLGVETPTVPEKPGGNNPGVIQNEEVAGTKKLREIPKIPILQVAGVTVKMQQSG